MTTLIPQKLFFDPASLGKEALLTDVSSYNLYKDGVRTNIPLGYKYQVALPAHALASLDVKIEGDKLMDVPVGEYTPVVFDKLEIKLYFDNYGKARLTAKAANIRAVSSADGKHT